MTVKDLIQKLLDVPMEADVAIIVSDRTDPGSLEHRAELGITDVVHRCHGVEVEDDCRIVVE